MKTFAEIHESETPIRDIVVEIIPRRGLTELELWSCYQRRCDTLKIMPLYGQLATGLKNLRRESRIEIRVCADGERRVFAKA